MHTCLYCVFMKQVGGRAVLYDTQTKTGNGHYISLLVIYRSRSAGMCVSHANVLQIFEILIVLLVLKYHE